MPLGSRGRQHPPVRDLNQKHLGLERRRFLGELASFRGLDEFLDVGRHLVTVAEQQGAAGNHLIDRLAERDTLRLQLLDVLGDVPVGGAPLFGYVLP